MSTTMYSIPYWSESQPPYSILQSSPCACPVCLPACFICGWSSAWRAAGMALASWRWALELILESVQSFSLQKLNLAAICLGLSVAATLPFAAPAVALLAVFLLWSKTTGGAGASARQFVNLALIFFLTAFVLLAIPLNHAEWKTLGVGATRLRQTINEITALSLGTSLKVIAAIARVALALVAIAGVFASVRCWRRRDGALLALTGATLALTLVL